MRFWSYCVYLTPAGEFKTLDEAAKAYGLTKEGARLRFKSKKRTDWIAYFNDPTGINIQRVY